MLTKIAYQCNDKQVLVEEVTCQESPLEPGVWLCPAGATFDAPPDIPDGKQAMYDFANQAWALVDQEAPPAPEMDEEPPAFSTLGPQVKAEQVKSQAQWLIQSAVAQAFQRMQWQDWNGTPVDPDLKTAWVQYRKALLQVPTQDQAYFIRLQTLEDYAWPTQPAMPADLA